MRRLCFTKVRLSLSVKFSAQRRSSDFNGQPTLLNWSRVSDSTKGSRSIEVRLYYTMRGSLSTAHYNDWKTLTTSAVNFESSTILSAFCFTRLSQFCRTCVASLHSLSSAASLQTWLSKRTAISGLLEKSSNERSITVLTLSSDCLSVSLT